jgi:FkbM family methyltransferase
MRGATAVAAAFLLGLAVTAAAVWWMGQDRLSGFAADAHAAWTWDNRVCSSLDAFRGLSKARAVTRRTAEIERASRLVGEDPTGLFLFETPHGDIWLPQRGDLHSVSVVLAEQELEMYGRAGGPGVHAGDVVIDVGAHVGLFTRTALAAGARQIVTFEVTPKSNQSLRRNLAPEIAAGKVIVIEKGAWHEESILPLVVVDDCSICNSVTHQMPAAFDVPLTTIDRVVEDLHLARVDFIKLDIENAEAQALRGARQTIARFHPRLAVALENARARLEYSAEVQQVVREAYDGYDVECGVCTNPERSHRILPEVLHFSPH